MRYSIKLLLSSFLILTSFFLILSNSSAVVSTFDEINYSSDYNLILVMDGDSITADVNNHGVQLRSLSGYFGKARFHNIAIPSLTADQIRNKYSTDIVGYKPSQINDEGYYIVYAGINDIMFSQSADSTYLELKDIWAQARADGFKVVAFTLAPTIFTETIGTNSQELVKLNKLIVSDASLYDYLVRPEFLINNYTNTVYYQSDQVHWTPEAYKQVARMIYNQIEARPFQTSASPSSTCSGLNCQDLILNPAGKKVYIGARGSNLDSSLNIYENSPNTDSHSGISIEQEGLGDSKIGFLLKNIATYSIGLDNLAQGSKFRLVSGTNLSRNIIFEAAYPGFALFSIGNKLSPSQFRITTNDSNNYGDSNIILEQLGSGDPRMQFIVNGIYGLKVWNIGVDYSDAGKFKISQGAKGRLEIQTALEIDTSANVRLPTGKLTISQLSGNYVAGSAYVCVKNNGELFASETACP
ncbi:MAG: SGNH/GDSL hydrolase family protein [Candidatus Pacearchaeota archaeon]